MLSKSYILLMGTILGLFLVFIGYTNVQAQNQIIIPDPTVKSVAPNKEFTFSVTYNVSDGNNMLAGIGIRIHYDSSILEYVEVSNIFEKGLLSIGMDPQAEDDNRHDEDDDTDLYVIAGLTSSDWPSEDLPITIFDIKFKVKQGVGLGVDTSINFTDSCTATGYGFESESLKVEIRAQTDVPDITVTPLTVDFGDVIVGATSTKTVTIENDGDADLSINDISITGSNNFSQTNNCLTSELSPGSSCTIDLEFSPTSEGDKTATLKITSDDPDEGEVDVSLAGKGEVLPDIPDITVTPLTVDFGNIILGATSTKEIAIKNDGDADLSINDISITGSNNFSQTNNCPSELSQGSSCTIDLKFSPTSEGNKSGTLKITSDDPDEGEVDVPLTGKGLSPGEGFQSITPDPTRINAVPGDEFTFSIKYNASSNALAGIGFYIHYSSSFLDFIEVSHVFQRGYLSLIGPEDDIDDRDNNPYTDRRFVVSWEDFTPPPSWPGTKLPLSLMDITFHVKEWICPPFDTSINFSVKDTAQGYPFLATPMELNIVSFHLDIDDNGKVEALTDGLLIIRYLFGFTGEDLVDGTIGSGANRDDPDEIADWIETGILEEHLDIDENGAVTPLTDGLVVVRYLFGFTGEDLVMGATDPIGGRTGSDEIVEYIEKHLMPF